MSVRNYVFVLMLSATAPDAADELAMQLKQLLRESYEGKSGAIVTFFLQDDEQAGALSCGLDLERDAFFFTGGGGFLGRRPDGQSYTEETVGYSPKMVDWYDEPAASNCIYVVMPVVLQRDIVLRNRPLANVELVPSGGFTFDVSYPRGQLAYVERVDLLPKPAPLETIRMQVDSHGRITRIANRDDTTHSLYTYDAFDVKHMSVPVQVEFGNRTYVRTQIEHAPPKAKFEPENVRQHITNVRADVDQMLSLVAEGKAKPLEEQKNLRSPSSAAPASRGTSWWMYVAGAIPVLVGLGWYLRKRAR